MIFPVPSFSLLISTNLFTSFHFCLSVFLEFEFLTQDGFHIPQRFFEYEVPDIVQETGIKTIPMEKKCKKAKWLSGEALQIAVKRREVKSKGEKECRVPKNSKKR